MAKIQSKTNNDIDNMIIQYETINSKLDELVTYKEQLRQQIYNYLEKNNISKYICENTALSVPWKVEILESPERTEIDWVFLSTKLSPEDIQRCKIRKKSDKNILKLTPIRTKNALFKSKQEMIKPPTAE